MSARHRVLVADDDSSIRALLRRPGATTRLPRLARAFGQAQAELTRLVFLVAGG